MNTTPTTPPADGPAKHRKSVGLSIDSIMGGQCDDGTVADELGTPWSARGSCVFRREDGPAVLQVTWGNPRCQHDIDYVIAAVNACAEAGLSLDDLANGLAGICEKQRTLCEANVRWWRDYLEPAELDDIANSIQTAPLACTAPAPLRPTALGLGAEPDEQLRGEAVEPMAGYGEMCEGRR